VAQLASESQKTRLKEVEPRVLHGFRSILRGRITGRGESPRNRHDSLTVRSPIGAFLVVERGLLGFTDSGT
jgi:hypothetical protein